MKKIYKVKSTKIFHGVNMAKKSETEKRQIRINLDEDVAEKLSWVVSAKGMKNESEYLNDLLKKKFENISKKSTIEEIEKI